MDIYIYTQTVDIARLINDLCMYTSFYRRNIVVCAYKKRYARGKYKEKI